jgi:serine/threonine protein kinase
MRDLKIKSKLGEGGFGIVYLVQDQITGEEFALKVTNHKTEVTYLVEESYSMVRELNSPYLVGIYEMYRYNSNSDFEDDRLYILTV